MKFQKPTAFWLILLVAILPLLGFWHTGLLDLDEGFYAAVVGEMNRRGEWITPYYNGSPWFEKPILLYWVAKPCVMIFGEMWGPRMPSILAAIAVYALVFKSVNKRFGEIAAAFSTLFLAGSLLMVSVSRMMLADGLLGLALVAMFLTFYESLEEPGKNRWLVGLCLGLTVLAKGPVGIILFCGVAGVTWVTSASLRPGFKRGWPGFFVAMTLVIASWYVPVYQANGQVFVQKFLIEQNIGRFTGGDKAHTVPFLQGFLLYLGIMLLGAAPWIYKLPKAIKSIGTNDTFLRFCAIWGLSILGFFTLSSAKLPHYILPALPPLAIVVGVFVAKNKIKDGATNLNFDLIKWPALWCVIVSLLANVGFSTYYFGTHLRVNGQPIDVVGFHSEVHDLCREAKAMNLDVIAFQMPRRQKSLGTLKPKIQETSHPSIAFYLNRPFIPMEEKSDLANQKKTILILTRANRITPEDVKNLASKGQIITQVQTKKAQDVYRLYLLEQIKK